MRPPVPHHIGQTGWKTLVESLSFRWRSLGVERESERGRGIKTSEQCDTRDRKDTKYEFSSSDARLGAK